MRVALLDSPGEKDLLQLVQAGNIGKDQLKGKVKGNMK
jgi:hypothetical protein